MTRSDKQDSPIFVVGASRSGTALLRSGLNAHPGVHLAGETHYFDDLRPRMGALARRPLSAADRDRCERYFLAIAHRPYGHGGRPESAPYGVEVLRSAADEVGMGADAYFEAFCRMDHDGRLRPASVRWGEKTPRHVFRIDELLARYPSAQIVCMVRDPRAVVASYRDWHDQEQGGFDLEADPGHADALAEERARTRASYDPSISSLLWRATVTAARQARARHGADTVRVQRYEDLVEAPEVQFQEVAAWLGIDFRPEMLHVPMHNSSFSRFAVGAGISRAPVDRWRQKLDPTEVATIQTWCRGAMGSVGYDLVAVDLTPAQRLVATRDLGLATFRALQANRGRMGRLPSYLWRRARLAMAN